jgi:hypothetical protein
LRELARGEAPRPLNAALRLGLWMGKDDAEANAMYELARTLGFTKNGAEALAHIASRKDCWAFARHIVERIGCSVRTFQRWVAKGKSLGLVHTYRGKKTEVPPGANAPIECGWCHRIVVGRGLARQERARANDEARARWLTNLVRRQTVPLELRKLAENARNPPPRRPPPGVSTSDWLEAELAELARAKQRDGPSS